VTVDPIAAAMATGLHVFPSGIFHEFG